MLQYSTQNRNHAIRQEHFYIQYRNRADSSKEEIKTPSKQPKKHNRRHARAHRCKGGGRYLICSVLSLTVPTEWVPCWSIKSWDVRTLREGTKISRSNRRTSTVRTKHTTRQRSERKFGSAPTTAACKKTPPSLEGRLFRRHTLGWRTPPLPPSHRQQRCKQPPAANKKQTCPVRELCSPVLLRSSARMGSVSVSVSVSVGRVLTFFFDLNVLPLYLRYWMYLLSASICVLLVHTA